MNEFSEAEADVTDPTTSTLHKRKYWDSNLNTHLLPLEQLLYQAVKLLHYRIIPTLVELCKTNNSLPVHVLLLYVANNSHCRISCDVHPLLN